MPFYKSSKKKKRIILYFFKNGRPNIQPYQVIGNQLQLENYELIEKTIRGELVLGNKAVYTMTGRPLCQVNNIKSNDGFVLVPFSHCFKEGAYHRKLVEFIRAKALCEKTMQLQECECKQLRTRNRSKSTDTCGSNGNYICNYSIRDCQSECRDRCKKKKSKSWSCYSRNKCKKNCDDIYKLTVACENCGHNSKGSSLEIRQNNTKGRLKRVNDQKSYEMCDYSKPEYHTFFIEDSITCSKTNLNKNYLLESHELECPFKTNSLLNFQKSVIKVSHQIRDSKLNKIESLPLKRRQELLTLPKRRKYSPIIDNSDAADKIKLEDVKNEDNIIVVKPVEDDELINGKLEQADSEGSLEQIVETVKDIGTTGIITTDHWYIGQIIHPVDSPKEKKFIYHHPKFVDLHPDISEEKFKFCGTFCKKFMKKSKFRRRIRQKKLWPHNPEVEIKHF